MNIDCATTYNDLGWATAVDDPNHGKSSTIYYSTGEVRSTTDANGDIATATVTIDVSADVDNQLVTSRITLTEAGRG
mgnify:CR=1 FL=1